MTSRGTTPTYILQLPEDIDLTMADHVIVTFSDANYRKLIEKTDSELQISQHEVEVYLSQAETLSFPLGSVLVQLNFTFTEGSKVKRLATTIERTDSVKNLKEVVIG